MCHSLHMGSFWIYPILMESTPQMTPIFETTQEAKGNNGIRAYLNPKCFRTSLSWSPGLSLANKKTPSTPRWMASLWFLVKKIRPLFIASRAMFAILLRGVKAGIISVSSPMPRRRQQRPPNIESKTNCR